MAATLATGGVLSHRSAGALWGLRPCNGRIDVTVPWTRPNDPDSSFTEPFSPPTRSPPTTASPSPPPPARQLDLAGVLQKHQLQQAINEARAPATRQARTSSKPLPDEARHQSPPHARTTNPHPKQDLEARFHHLPQ